ncbi:MAG: spore maturation protein [Lachnospiraceae bacterium]|nr:spore maturation protein [Lachnospiraceae bacterium]MDD7078239.1 spore maturation protein [Lachnospiraceae bacterium]MDY3730508.1 spore maturation protein [Candidatus Choladocola sp.]
MKFVLYLSQMIIPFLIFYIVGCGILSKVPVYDSFIRGAGDGLKTVVKIVPTMIGLMVASGVLRASGFLDFLGGQLGSISSAISFPGELVPLTILRMFSSSAATGLLLDLYKEYGTDSHIGLTASLMMCCTETIFYTMSLYFMTAGIKKTRHTLCGALLSTFAGIAASVMLANLMLAA